MKRRRLSATVLVLLASPSMGRSQSRKSRVAFLGGTMPDARVQRVFIEPFRQTLRELGHEEGRNLAIDFRFAEGKPERLPALAAELLALGPDVLMTMGPRPAYAAKAATNTVPIVAAAVDDPVEMGLAATMARPGGNVTGVSGWGIELVAKRLQLLKDLVPAVRRVGILVNPIMSSPVNAAAWTKALAEFEQRLDIKILEVQARGPKEFEAAFATFARGKAEAMVLLGSSFFVPGRRLIPELALQHKLPSVFPNNLWADNGGLMSYGPDFTAAYRRAAEQVAKLLNGAKPGDMPIEQPNIIEMVINLITAKALGIVVPQALRLRADRLIE